MPSTCTITFNQNSDGVYYSGQKLSGKILLETDKIKATRGIYITIRGYADVRWSETRSRGMTQKIYFRGRDDYFVSKTYVMVAENQTRFDLLPGEYEFSFKNYLPYILPSSFIGKYGEIRYEVILTIERPWRFDNVFKHPFTIICPLDLSTNPIYRQPVDKAIKKHYTKMFCCGDGGEILVTGHMQYSGYAPGQHIPIDIIIKNFSSTECYEARLRLIKTVEYRSSTPHCKRRNDPVTLVEHKFGPFDSFREKTLNCCLRVPPVPPTTLQICKIIELSYYVELTLNMKGFHSDMKMRLPVTIGTIPLFYGGLLTPNIVSRQPLSSSTSLVSMHHLPAPPSYEQATLVDTCYLIEVEEDQPDPSARFIPKYPVYYEFEDFVMCGNLYSTHHPFNEMKQRY